MSPTPTAHIILFAVEAWGVFVSLLALLLANVL